MIFDRYGKGDFRVPLNLYKKAKCLKKKGNGTGASSLVCFERVGREKRSNGCGFALHRLYCSGTGVL